MPELRIIDQELWEAVRSRQGAMKTKNTDTPVWDRRRPKTLFSGLMTCGTCGGGFAKVSQTQFGCSRARNKGKAICTNMATISQVELESLILNALQNNLMDQEALAVFCDEYAKERNRLQAEASQNRNSVEKELIAAKRDHSKLIDAILAGVPAEQVKDRMIALDARRIDLEAQLSREPAPSPLRIHPKMAETYRAQVRLLIDQLQQPEGMLEAKEALRGLIDRIVLTPDAATGRLSFDLEGALARLLWLAVEAEGRAKRKKPAGAGCEVPDIYGELVLVAGACNRRNLPQLKTAV